MAVAGTLRVLKVDLTPTPLPLVSGLAARLGLCNAIEEDGERPIQFTDKFTDKLVEIYLADIMRQSQHSKCTGMV